MKKNVRISLKVRIVIVLTSQIYFCEIYNEGIRYGGAGAGMCKVRQSLLFAKSKKVKYGVIYFLAKVKVK